MLVTGRFLPVVISLCGAVESASALDGPPGITQYSVLPPFNPAAAACGPPPGLEHQLAFVQENDREFLQGVNYGLEAAAKDRGLTYVEDLSNDDAVLAATQLNALTATKTGAIVVTSADPDAVHPGIQQFIWSGGFAGTMDRRSAPKFSMHRSIKRERRWRTRRSTTSMPSLVEKPTSSSSHKTAHNI